MQYDHFQRTLQDSVALKLLGSQHAPLILSFLHQQFKQQHQLTIFHSLLVERLDDYLAALREMGETSHGRTAAQYLSEWCDDKHRYLRKYHVQGQDDPVYELTADTERALTWVEELQKREFVGTESRFLRIFELLRDIVRHSSEDVETRLRYLEEEKERVEREIGRIRATGTVETYTSTQIKEKFDEASDTARRLLADFREVEDNFRAMAREVQQKQLTAHIRKGEIVGYVLDAADALRDSDQGRSFYAFWQFLMSQSKQDELRDLLQEALNMAELPLAADRQALLRHLKRSLIEAGSKIVESNRRLAEQLRKLLDEQNLQEARRVKELSAEIKQAALRLAQQNWQPNQSFFTTVAGGAEVAMPMMRPLYTPRPQPNLGQVVLEMATADPEPEILDTLYAQFFVDERLLLAQIDHLLEQRPHVTLSDLLANYPLQKGLAELLVYFTIAIRTEQHTIEPTTVTLPLSAEREISVPQVVFGR